MESGLWIIYSHIIGDQAQARSSDANGGVKPLYAAISSSGDDQFGITARDDVTEQTLRHGLVTCESVAVETPLALETTTEVSATSLDYVDFLEGPDDDDLVTSDDEQSFDFQAQRRRSSINCQIVEVNQNVFSELCESRRGSLRTCTPGYTTAASAFSVLIPYIGEVCEYVQPPYRVVGPCDSDHYGVGISSAVNDPVCDNAGADVTRRSSSDSSSHEEVFARADPLLSCSGTNSLDDFGESVESESDEVQDDIFPTSLPVTIPSSPNTYLLVAHDSVCTSVLVSPGDVCGSTNADYDAELSSPTVPGLLSPEVTVPEVVPTCTTLPSIDEQGDSDNGRNISLSCVDLSPNQRFSNVFEFLDYHDSFNELSDDNKQLVHCSELRRKSELAAETSCLHDLSVNARELDSDWSEHAAHSAGSKSPKQTTDLDADSAESESEYNQSEILRHLAHESLSLDGDEDPPRYELDWMELSGLRQRSSCTDFENDFSHPYVEEPYKPLTADESVCLDYRNGAEVQCATPSHGHQRNPLIESTLMYEMSTSSDAHDSISEIINEILDQVVIRAFGEINGFTECSVENLDLELEGNFDLTSINTCSSDGEYSSSADDDTKNPSSINGGDQSWEDCYVAGDYRSSQLSLADSELSELETSRPRTRVGIYEDLVENVRDITLDIETILADLQLPETVLRAGRHSQRRRLVTDLDDDRNCRYKSVPAVSTHWLRGVEDTSVYRGPAAAHSSSDTQYLPDNMVSYPEERACLNDNQERQNNVDRHVLLIPDSFDGEFESLTPVARTAYDNNGFLCPGSMELALARSSSSTTLVQQQPLGDSDVCDGNLRSPPSLRLIARRAYSALRGREVNGSKLTHGVASNVTMETKLVLTESEKLSEENGQTTNMDLRPRSESDVQDLVRKYSAETKTKSWSSILRVPIAEAEVLTDDDEDVFYENFVDNISHTFVDEEGGTDGLHRLGSLSKEAQETTASVRERLQSLLPPGETFTQRCVIVQKDERGYGLTVSGENPVYVDSIKADGAAAQAGVREGDMIVKVNGNLVAKSNHKDVVKLIKSGTYVSLTLLSKQSSKDSVSSSKPSVSSPTSDWITGPQPVDVEKDQEFSRQKIDTFRHMYTQALADYEQIKHEYERSPNDKLLHSLNDSAKTLRNIQAQLNALENRTSSDGQSHTLSPEKTQKESFRTSPIAVDSPLCGDEDEGVDVASVKDTSEHSADALWDGPRHKKTESMPETLYDSDDYLRVRQAAIPRSVSDVSDTHRARMKNADSCPALDQVKNGDKSRTQSMPASMYDSGSMSDSPVNSRTSSPTPVQAVDDLVGPSEVRREQTKIQEPVQVSTVPSLKAQLPAMSTSPPQDSLTLHSATIGDSPQTHLRDIINMEDDDFDSEDEHQFDDHGPFTSLNSLMKHPAHLAVFLSYLVSNQNPASMFFYLLTETYAQGNQKEMKKWAYELHSTFLNDKAPLSLPLDDDLVGCVDNVLITKGDQEPALRTIFDDIRLVVREQVTHLLQEFCHTRSLGLGSLYGDHELSEIDSLDRSALLKLVDKNLTQHLENLLEKEEASDRNLAIAMCICSFMKNLGVQRSAMNQRFFDKINSYNEKDRRMFRFKGSRKIHYYYNHSFVAQHYFNTTYCNYCAGILWGVGNQGYQCHTCDQNYHKTCLESLKEPCAGQSFKAKKDKTKRTSFVEKIITRKPSTNSPTAIREAQLLVESGLTSPSHVTSTSTFHIQETVKEDDDEDRGGVSSRVGLLVNRYQKIASNKDEVIKAPDESPTTSDKEAKRDSPVGRSESLKGRKDRSLSGSVRRTKSDVAADDGSLMQALDQAVASSSSSSLSTKSASPSTSLEHVNRVVHEDDSDFEVENELPPLDAVLQKDVLKKLKPKEKKRQEVINELFYTERSHLRNLKILDHVFYQPWHNEPLLPHKLVTQILPNIAELISLHSSVNNAMKAVRPQEGHPFGDVADVLLHFFEGESGDAFKKASAVFCRNHRTALDQLKIKIRKDQKLASFLQEAEANPLCRRLKLADLIPMQMQRLTKYRLLVENLLKYTQTNSAEHSKLQAVLQHTKEILHVVNQAIKDCEDQQKLEWLQKRMEKRQLQEYANDPQVRNLDLTKHKLCYDGTLMLKDGKSKMIDVHVVLLEDILVILQKQDDKLVLKPLSSKAMNSIRDSTKDDSIKYTSPVVQLAGLLTRNVATDNRAFFLVSISLDSRAGSRIYELHAASVDERKKWFKYISDASEAFSKNAPSSLRRPPKSTPKQASTSQESAEDAKEIEKDIDQKDDQSVKMARSDSVENVGKLGIMTVEEQALPLLQHSGDVSHAAMTGDVSHVVMSGDVAPSDLLRQKDRAIEVALMDKHRAIAEMLGMPADEFENIAELASAMTDEKEPRELIVAAILQTSRLTMLAKDTLQPTTPRPPVDSSGDVKSTPPQREFPNTVHLPVPILLQIVTTLNEDLTQLLRIVREREDEMDILRHDLKAAREQLRILQDVSLSRSPGDSRPNSFISVGSELSADETGDELTSNEVSCSTPQPPLRVVTQHDDNSPSSPLEDGPLTPLAPEEEPEFTGESVQELHQSVEREVATELIQITINCPSPEKPSDVVTATVTIEPEAVSGCSDQETTNEVEESVDSITDQNPTTNSSVTDVDTGDVDTGDVDTGDVSSASAVTEPVTSETELDFISVTSDKEEDDDEEAEEVC